MLLRVYSYKKSISLFYNLRWIFGLLPFFVFNTRSIVIVYFDINLIDLDVHNSIKTRYFLHDLRHIINHKIYTYTLTNLHIS